MPSHAQPSRIAPLLAQPFLLLALALAGCGGGSSGSSQPAASTAAVSVPTDALRARALAVNASGWVTITAPADPTLQNLTIPVDASSKGMWSGVKSWPLNGLHAALLPNGRVLSYGSTLDGATQNGRYLDLWDPTQGFVSAGHQTTYRADQQDSFCSAATFLGDGRLMMSGGNGSVTSSLYSPSTNSIATSSANLADERWYATMLNLPDGRPLIVGGMVPYSESMQDNPDQAVAQGLASMTPEVYEGGAWRSLFGAYSRDAFGPDYLRASYPRAWVAPDGRVFGISAETMWYLDASGNGSITVAGRFKQAPSATALPNVGATNSAVMYAPGKILVAGGNGSFNGDALPASRMATVVDINGAAPLLTEQPVMSYARRYPNTVVLPDGRVLVTGGTAYGNSNGANAVYAAELWNPATSAWTVGANAAIYRGYHSFSILMPNGSVLSTGGGAPGPVTNVNAELYYPSYLFRSVGGAAQLAPRPVMKAISGLSYLHGASLQIDMADAAGISQLVLIGTSTGTHSFNPSQRRIPLSFSQDSYRLTATLPGNTIAPPGYYQVIALDANGVPSVGSIIALGQGVSAPPVTTTPYNPPDLGGSISAPLIAAGGTASYTVPALADTTYSWDFGDGSPATAFSASSSASHAYAQAGVYVVSLTARAADGSTARRSFFQGVSAPATANKPASSSATAIEARSAASARLWVVNPDNNSVSVIDSATQSRVAEIAVGISPRSVAFAPNGRVWVVNKGSASLSIIDPASFSVLGTVALPRASQPHGLVFAPGGANAYVVLEAAQQLLKLDPASGATRASLAIGPNARQLSISADAASVLVSRFVTPALPGESTAVVDTGSAGAEVLVVNPASMIVTKTVILRHSDKTDTEIQGSGIPNYLGAAVISPDGQSAWVPSKQDNIKRGSLRNGQPLDFQNTVRAISSRIDMASLAEDYPRRIDHDNSSLGSAAVYHPSGVYLFVALETSRQVAVVDAIGGRELIKLDVGRAPQGLSVTPDGKTLYVQNFMDRSVSVLDIGPLVTFGELRAPLLATIGTVATEQLPAQVLAGKQLFYDARDPRLARDSYMSCASCHSDAGHDGRVWDFSGFGEGLRNTIALKGRAGSGHGFMHWSANFDEVQDFEKQIRDFAGGTGLMSDELYNTGTRNQALGTRKAGLSADLDALAAYLGSLSSVDRSPFRNADGSLTTAAVAGKAVFQSANCASCHGGVAFTLSADGAALKNIGTIKTASGKRLGGPLAGIDVPTLRDVWASAPYLHDGSAPSLGAAVQAHAGNPVGAADLGNLVAYLQQIGGEEAGPNAPVAGGSGLMGSYYASNNLSGPVVLQRLENINFNWGAAAPATMLPADNYSARWSGYVEATTAGTYQFQSNSDDGVRVWLDGQRVIDNWTVHAATLNTAAPITLAAGQRVSIVVEYQDLGGNAVMQLSWKVPGATAFAIVPATQLYASLAGGSGLQAAYYGSNNLSGAVLMQRIENINLDWGTGAPASILPADNFSARWSGYVQATVAGSYRFQTNSDDGVRVSVNGASVINNWTAHAPTLDTSAAITLAAGQRVPIVVEYQEFGGGAQMQLNWLTPGAAAYASVPSTQLYTVAASSAATRTTCAQENGSCKLPSGLVADVYYGANGSYAVKYRVTGSIACTNAVFGDPIPGTVKSCAYAASP